MIAFWQETRQLFKKSELDGCTNDPPYSRATHASFEGIRVICVS
ncbi:MAG: hypothetical protein ACLRPC_04450 [Streptococcus sp.]